MKVTDLVEKAWIPDVLIRAGIRRRCHQRLREAAAEAGGDPDRKLGQFAQTLMNEPVAVHTEEANEQHYELPAAFFEKVLGPRLKYSSAYWNDETIDLGAAEDLMLSLCETRAEIKDGQHILDLGCGWGSLSLYLAERHPSARITAVSNSHSQRAFIIARAEARGLRNLRVLTADIREFETEERFDRVMSIEMFEHMKNYEVLLEQIHGWLRANGKLFVHVFAHRRFAYHFNADNSGEWMARHFFTGGLMPAVGLLPRFQSHLRLEEQWEVPGTHYEKTANAWLRNMDAARRVLVPAMEATYGEAAGRWWRRWRIFFMACAELFGYEDGTEWVVAHYRFAKRS